MHHISFRHLVPLQVLSTAVIVNCAWRPITQLLLAHPRLTEQAVHFCQQSHDVTSLIIGLPSGRPGSAAAPPCPPAVSASRLVLMVQIFGNMFAPLLIVYVLESRAKKAFLLKRQNGSVQVHLWWEWLDLAWYVVLAMGSYVICDMAADVIHAAFWAGL